MLTFAGHKPNRDSLLGAPVHDVDCATKLMPAEVIAACTKAGIRTVPTGIEHGTVTAILIETAQPVEFDQPLVVIS